MRYGTGGGRKKLVDAYRNRGLETKIFGKYTFGNTRRRRRRGRSMSNDKKILYFIFLLIHDIISFPINPRKIGEEIREMEKFTHPVPLETTHILN